MMFENIKEAASILRRDPIERARAQINSTLSVFKQMQEELKQSMALLSLTANNKEDEIVAKEREFEEFKEAREAEIIECDKLYEEAEKSLVGLKKVLGE